MVTKSLIPPPMVETFRDRGFVVVPDLLTRDELDRFGAAVTEVVLERRAGDRRELAEMSRYEQSFIQCKNLWEDHPDIRPLTFHPLVSQAAAELLEVERVRLWHDQALYKEPGGRVTDAHQDQPYWPIEEPLTITAWIPFEGSTLDSGAMGYVSGSHRVGLRRWVNIFDGNPEDLLGRPELRGMELEFVEVPAGSVAFHHGLTAHLAKPNRSAGPRAVHTVIYFADGCHRRDDDQPHFAVDRAGIPRGGLIESDLTPIAWPRLAGDLPASPKEELQMNIKGR